MDTTSSALLSRLDVLEEVQAKLKSSVDLMQNNDRVEVITYGGLCLRDEVDVTGWMTTNLPPSFPFGLYVDSYSFLERIVSTKVDEATTPTATEDMHVRHKVSLTASESMTIDAFKHSSPRMFLQGSTTANATKTYLPALSAKEYWEITHRLGGMKSRIDNSFPKLEDKLKLLLDLLWHIIQWQHLWPNSVWQI